MTPALELALIASLAALGALASATAGAWWWRSRAGRLADLVRELAERQRALEAIVERLERAGGRPSTTGRSRPILRPDSPTPPRGPLAGPTLIAVPDLAAGPAPGGPAAASADLGRRFGVLWDLAEAGAAPEAIARQTGYPIGQVELILGLRRRFASTEGRP